MGWHDHHCKAFACNAGTNTPGATAKKKRQRDDGSNCYKEFAWPEALELCCAGCGKIDQHNRPFPAAHIGLREKMENAAMADLHAAQRTRWHDYCRRIPHDPGPAA
jgi:hypothetical protein